ncbi:acyl-homoserine-lactone synthase [Mesorhizobium sp. LNHC252B00]|uniref:acyl-homoserine-lactone synthase n=1 Tax=Mesorhizobium sp. LNHC252B00 TaxID=1287252 RepID=UPI000401CC1E|nr:acyl-homoserine-lactone synthase [Mesorhizobium sp. LNHC252B00]
MIQLIAPECYDDFAHDLHAMHRLRFRIFKERLDWDVQDNGGYEIDSFDALKPHCCAVSQQCYSASRTSAPYGRHIVYWLTRRP